jgi:superfamily II DNA/RNA helicase
MPRSFLSGPGTHVVTLIGGMDITKQMNALRHRPQILIGTPGRIVDLIHQNCIDLSALSLLIFDEADQIISTGQREETEEIRQLYFRCADRLSLRY